MGETSGEWPFGDTAEERPAECGSTEGDLLKRVILGLDPTAEALLTAEALPIAEALLTAEALPIAEALLTAEALPYYRDDNSLLRHYFLPKGIHRA